MKGDVKSCMARERACVISLSFAKCIGNIRESWMLASRSVAQRAVLESHAVPHRYACLHTGFSLSEHSLETESLICYRCTEF